MYIWIQKQKNIQSFLKGIKIFNSQFICWVHSMFFCQPLLKWRTYLFLQVWNAKHHWSTNKLNQLCLFSSFRWLVWRYQQCCIWCFLWRLTFFFLERLSFRLYEYFYVIQFSQLKFINKNKTIYTKNKNGTLMK